MSYSEEISQQIFGSSSSIMAKTPQKKEKQQKKRKSNRRLTLLPEEIAEIKVLAAIIP